MQITTAEIKALGFKKYSEEDQYALQIDDYRFSVQFLPVPRGVSTTHLTIIKFHEDDTPPEYILKEQYFSTEEELKKIVLKKCRIEL
jgi:hypothetical protein